jgi:DNA-binding CsgD family transcriptional regulator
MAIDLDRLFSSFAGLVGRATLSDRDIGNTFCDIMESVVRFDHCVVFAYHGSERPIDLYSTFDASDYEVFVSLYQEGPYLLDPFYRTATIPQSGVFRMRELAPDRFFSSEYFRSYYEKTGLAEEVGFFVPAVGDVTVTLSLMRKASSGAFSNAEFAALAKAEPLVRALVGHYWQDVEHRFEAASPGRKRWTGGDDVNARVWSKLNLTGREIAIIELVLQGYSSESIGLQLSIATGTVKVHRRNIYRKLGISSQTQLLSLYLANIREAR